MRTFNYLKLKDKLWSNEILAYVSSIHEEKGKQNIYLSQQPEKFEKLVEIAKVQSTEASNYIEGISTTSIRLKKLCAKKTTPKNRNEEEIAGYRDALNLIHENYEFIPINTNHILQLHKIMFSHQPNNMGGKFKNVQNYISTTNSLGETTILFTPLPPYQTPQALDDICFAYNEAIAYNTTDPLILIPIFIHDFLCIHPFLDGNGRMSRLLTTLLLYKQGFMVGKYISLENIIAKNKDLYYSALEKSQYQWHNENEDNTPFISYILSTVLSAYRELENRYALFDSKLTALEIVQKALPNIMGKFTKSQLLNLCPNISISSMENVLRTLIDNKEIERHNEGKKTFYTKLK